METPNTHDDQPDEQRPGISRRETLKRLGVATAAVWAAPTVLSTSAALAGTEGTPVDGGCSAEDFTCGGEITLCGSGNSVCFCDKDAEGNTRCFVDSVCGGLGSCSTSADCPEGTYCVPTTCCEGAVCVRLCPGPDDPAEAPAIARLGGSTTTSRS